MFEVHLTQTDFFHEIRIPRTNLKLKKKFIFIFKKLPIFAILCSKITLPSCLKSEQFYSVSRQCLKTEPFDKWKVFECLKFELFNISTTLFYVQQMSEIQTNSASKRSGFRCMFLENVSENWTYCLEFIHFCVVSEIQTIKIWKVLKSIQMDNCSDFRQLIVSKNQTGPVVQNPDAF